MTNFEALKANISDVHGVVLTQDHFMKCLIDVDLSPYESYSDAKKIDLATIKVYDLILGGANFSEGTINYNINIDAVRKSRQELQIKHGLLDNKNKVTSPKIW